MDLGSQNELACEGIVLDDYSSEKHKELMVEIEMKVPGYT